VTFPSFHTAISVAVVIACWSVPYLRYPALVANALLVAGVPVWGSHYFVDVAAGAFLTAMTVLAWRRMFSPSGLPERPARPYQSRDEQAGFSNRA
jgi:membrane-associated phospholipid phosphatase